MKKTRIRAVVQVSASALEINVVIGEKRIAKKICLLYIIYILIAYFGFFLKSKEHIHNNKH